MAVTSPLLVEAMRRVSALLQAGGFQGAHEQLETIVAANPGYVEALRLLAGTKQALGDAAAAEGLLRLSTRIEREQFVIEIKDDGRGIDWPGVSRKATALGLPAEEPAQQSAAQQQQIPDGPKPQIPDVQIPDAPRPQRLPPGTPGRGTTPDSSGNTSSTSQDNSVPNKLPETAAQKADDGLEPEVPAAGQGPEYVIRARVNFVEIPFTVKDNKGNLVAGISPREVRVYENNLRQQLSLFTTDAFPLSVALVIDQSMTFDNMAKVNNSLGALQGAFTPYDEIAVFTYNNGPKMVTAFTAGPSARLTQALDRSKQTGREPMMYSSGPLSQNISINGGQDRYTDPNTNPSHGTSQLGIPNVPRDVHTLNDAILEAATALAKTAPGRRRLVYVISDGREYGSKAKYSEVVKYLNTNKIAVFGTLVGDSAPSAYDLVRQVWRARAAGNDTETAWQKLLLTI